MDLQKYEITTSDDWLIYEFISKGPKGQIKKVVIYQHIIGNLYNLAFGDKTGEFGNLDDLVISNNEDTEIVLATVASTIYAFFDHHEGSIVLAKGSTKSRTRLYRRHLSLLLDLIEKDFLLFGELNNEIERFVKNKEYSSFIISKR
ncbi:MAG: hypothetical protein KDC49_15085 [Saprospiraceae bacterium]|nr:hypothetical protein [Saprospiraceae bacterium]